ncbi:MAG: nucleotidyltransferase domain-containing protein [Candidatus Woesearchaeota archaeon]
MNNIIERIITSCARRSVLTLFLKNPDSRYYLREIARITGEHVNAISKETTMLREIGFLTEEKVANLCYYMANRDFVVFEDLRKMFLKLDPIEQEISEAMGKAQAIFRKNLTSIVLFGSYARNEHKEYSDIDMLIVCKNLPEDWRKRDAISLDIGKVSRKYGRAVHTTLATEDEIYYSVRDGAPLLLEVATSNRIMHDTGFFAKHMETFRKNMKEWKARKLDKYAWEVPGLAIKT